MERWRLIVPGPVASATYYGYHGHVKKANISTLKNNLSEHIRFVRAGGTVRIYDRDTPVAEISPISQRSLPSARLEQLEREGAVRRPKKGAQAVTAILARQPVRSSASVLAALLEERKGGR